LAILWSPRWTWKRYDRAVGLTELFLEEEKWVLTLTLSFTPYQTFIFLEILFWNSESAWNLRKKVDKFYFLSKPPKITFRGPKLQTPIKPVGNIFDRRDPKKPPLNWSFPTKSLLTYFVILLFMCCT
jgi:hypothetical protein